MPLHDPGRASLPASQRDPARTEPRPPGITQGHLVEEVGAVEGALEVGAILIFAHLLHINPGAIREHLDRLPGRIATRPRDPRT